MKFVFTGTKRIEGGFGWISPGDVLDMNPAQARRVMSEPDFEPYQGAVEQVVSDDDTEPASDQVDGMSRPELLKEAESLGIKYAGKMKPHTLRERIKDALEAADSASGGAETSDLGSGDTNTPDGGADA